MATTSPRHRGSNLKRIRNLEQEAANLRTHLWWLVGGGEFATWVEGKAMPLAVRQEFEAARQVFNASNFDQHPEHPESAIKAGCSD
jgi:hypothetical protein